MLEELSSQASVSTIKEFIILPGTTSSSSLHLELGGHQSHNAGERFKIVSSNIMVDPIQHTTYRGHDRQRDHPDYQSSHEIHNLFTKIHRARGLIPKNTSIGGATRVHPDIANDKQWISSSKESKTNGKENDANDILHFGSCNSQRFGVWTHCLASIGRCRTTNRYLVQKVISKGIQYWNPGQQASKQGQCSCQP